MENYVVIKRSNVLTQIITATPDYALARKLAEKFKDAYSETQIIKVREAELYLNTVWNVWLDGDEVLRCESRAPSDFGVYSILDNVYTTSKGKISTHVMADTEAEAISKARKLQAEYLKQKNSPEGD